MNEMTNNTELNTSIATYPKRLRMSLITPDEKKIIDDVLKDVVEFISAPIPVVHYRRSLNGGDGDWVYDKIINKESGKKEDAFFMENYSWVFSNGKRTGYDLVLLMKLFCHKTRYENLWELMTTKKNDEKNIMVVFRLMKAIDEVIWGNKKNFINIKSYIDDSFRSGYGELDYMVAQDPSTLNFMHHLRSIRNKSEHPDKKFPLFYPPKDPRGWENYWNDARRRVVMFALMTIDRFYDELYERLVEPSDEEVLTDDEQTSSELGSKGKEVLGLYINEMHEKMQKRLSSAFLGNGIQDMPDLYQRLPDPQLTLAKSISDADTRIYDDDPESINNAEVMLADDMEHNVKLVVGEAGSGKSVMFYRMILRDQPRLTPFYMSLDERKDITDQDMLQQIERRVIGCHLLTLDAWQLHATKQRLRKRLAEGSAVFFIDTLDAAPQSFPILRKFIATFPECQYIIGARPDCITLVLQQLEEMKVKRYNVQPLSIRQQRALVATASMHISGTDHTEILMHAISSATNGSDMSQHPFSLMMLISLFENKDNETMTVNNVTSLYYELEKKIKGADNLDNKEKEELLSQSFLKSFSDNCKEVVDLCQTVYNNYTKDPQDSSKWEHPILENSMVRQDLDGKDFHQWRTLYEYIEVVAERSEGWIMETNSQEEAKKDLRRRNTDLLNTLLTVTLIKQGVRKQPVKGLPAPNPVLVKLAQATATIRYRPPQSDNRGQGDGNGEQTFVLVYRLQPRYIVQQYLLTLMEHYRRYDVRHPVTFCEHGDQLESLFTAIAGSGSPLLINRLFLPFWMRLWLIQQEDELPLHTDVENKTWNGLAFDGSPLPEIIIHNSANHVTFILQLLKQLQTWVVLWDIGKTKKECQRIIRDIIIFKMDDREREILYQRLNSDKAVKSFGERNCDFYGNMAIASMESLSLADRFKTNAEMQGRHVIDRLMDKKGDPKAISLLLTIMGQIRLKMNKRFGRQQEDLADTIFYICRHLIRYGIVDMSEENVNIRFWQFIKQLIDDRHHLMTSDATFEPSDLASKILDLCPLEDIDHDIAEEIYDMPVFTYLQGVKKKERKAVNKWVETKKEAFNRDLYSPVTPFNSTWSPRRSVRYTFFCQPSTSRFFVATECINEMPEGKFCRISDMPDQWFLVEDVQILKTEHPITDIAEITINLPAEATRRKHGSITLDIPTADGTGLQPLSIRYFHLFDMGTHPQVVIRTEDQNAIRQLKRKETVDFLKANRSIVWDGLPALLSGIDIRNLNEHMRIIEIRPVTGRRPIRFMNIPDIPHEGTLSFYHYTGNDKDNRPLILATTGPDTIGAKESLSAKKRLDSFVFLGSDKSTDHKFIALDDRSLLNEGNVLMWDEASMAFSKVVKIHDTSDNKKPDDVPDFIWKSYAPLTTQIRKAIWKENKNRDKKSRLWMPNFVQIAELEIINNLKTPFAGKPGVIEKGADIAFYLPIKDPVRPSWTRKAEKTVLDGVLARLRIDDDKYALAVPADIDYPKSVRYYAADNYPHRLPVKWCQPQHMDSNYKYIRLDDRMIKLWDDNQSIYFYPDLEQVEPVSLQLPLLSVDIDLMNSKRYHADIVPFLEREWLSSQNGKLTEVQRNFCQQKKHDTPNS